GEGYVAEIADAARAPWIELERHVHPARHRGDVTHRARAQVLVALGRAVAGGMRHSNQGDIAAARIAIDRTAEESWDVPPIEPLDHHLVAGGKLHPGHGNAPVGLNPARVDDFLPQSNTSGLIAFSRFGLPSSTLRRLRTAVVAMRSTDS